MSQYKVRITRQAREHLQAIRSYIASTLFAPGTANELTGMLYAEMKNLSELPERIKLIDEEPWHRYDIRKKTAGNFYIYFWINESKKQVQVIAVIYAKRDQKKTIG